MKTSPALLATLVLGLGLARTTYAQEAGAEAAVQAALEETRAAVTACDIDAFTKHWDEEASIFIVRGDSLAPIAAYPNVWKQVCVESGRRV